MAENVKIFPEEVRKVVLNIAEILKERKETIAIVEGACGGLISAALLSVPGASVYYRGGTLVYSLESRLKLSGWARQDVQNYTGPSEEVVLRLARNLQIELRSTYALAESGVAGPGVVSGENKDDDDDGNNNTGKDFVGIVGGKASGGRTQVTFTGSSDREDNMYKFTYRALLFLLEVLREDGRV